MTTQEIISHLEHLFKYVRYSEDAPALREAIEMLRCSEIPNSSDTISRQAAINSLHMHLMYRMGTDSNKKRLDDWINNLPSAQPEIVRCKECINHGKEICYFWSRFYGTINTPDDGFCHKAERRTDD